MKISVDLDLSSVYDLSIKSCHNNLTDSRTHQNISKEKNGKLNKGIGLQSSTEPKYVMSIFAFIIFLTKQMRSGN